MNLNEDRIAKLEKLIKDCHALLNGLEFETDDVVCTLPCEEFETVIMVKDMLQAGLEE